MGTRPGSEGLHRSYRRLPLVILVALAGLCVAVAIHESTGLRQREIANSRAYANIITALLTIGSFASLSDISRKRLPRNLRLPLARTSSNDPAASLLIAHLATSAPPVNGRRRDGGASLGTGVEYHLSEIPQNIMIVGLAWLAWYLVAGRAGRRHDRKGAMLVGVDLPAGLPLGATGFLMTPLDGPLIARGWPRRDRVSPVLGRQNDLTHAYSRQRNLGGAPWLLAALRREIAIACESQQTTGGWPVGCAPDSDVAGDVAARLMSGRG
jgi:hypothetical protein